MKSPPISRGAKMPRILAALIVSWPAVAAIPVLPLLIPNPPVDISTTGNGISGAACFSGNGRFLYFSSSANTIVTNPPATASLRLFRRNSATDAVELVPSPPFGSVVTLAASVDGSRLLVRASNRSDPDQCSQLYLIDTASGESRAANATAAGAIASSPCIDGLMTPDGQWIAFVTQARLTNDDTNSVADVYLWNTLSGVRRRISQQPSETRASSPELVGVSENGRYLAYRLAAVISPAPTGAQRATDLIIADLELGTESRLEAPFNSTRNGRSIASSSAVLSDSGRSLAARFDSVPGASSNPQSPGIGAIFWWDLAAGTSLNVVPRSSYRQNPGAGDPGPAMAADGRTLALLYLDPAQPTAPNTLRVWSPEAGLQTLASVALTVPPRGLSPDPLLPDEITWAPDSGSLYFTAQSSTNTPARSLYRWELASGQSQLISQRTDGKAVDLTTAFPVISPDGQNLAFTSGSPDIVPGDQNHAIDLFVANVTTGKIAPAGPAIPGVHLPFADGRQFVGERAMSANGQRIVFTSISAEWSPQDQNVHGDVFLYDGVSGHISLVSQGTNGLSGPGDSFAPILSANGQCVVYFSRAPGLTSGTNGSIVQAYHQNLSSGRTQRISRRAATENGALNQISNPVLSADGQWVAFIADSTAGLINPAPAPGRGVYVFNAALGEIRWLYSFAGPSSSEQVRISDDGGIVVAARGSSAGRFFEVAAIQLSAPGTVRTWQTNITSLALSPDGAQIAFTPAPFGFAKSINVAGTFGAGAPVEIYRNEAATAFSDLQFTGDGRHLRFIVTSQSPPAGSDLGQDLIVTPVTGVGFEVVSTPFAGSNSGSRISGVSASADGRFVAFRSSMALVQGATPASHIYVRDRQRGIVYAVDPGAEFGGGNPLLSADGRTLAFTSRAALAPGDPYGWQDLFHGPVLDDALPIDSDGDGLPDEWEYANFHTLQQGPNDDFDGDGASNLQELIALTSPIRKPTALSFRRLKAGSGDLLHAEFTPEQNTQLRLFKRRQLDDQWVPIGATLYPSHQKVVWEHPISSSTPSEFIKLEIE